MTFGSALWKIFLTLFVTAIVIGAAAAAVFAWLYFQQNSPRTNDTSSRYTHYECNFMGEIGTEFTLSIDTEAEGDRLLLNSKMQSTQFTEIDDLSIRFVYETDERRRFEISLNKVNLTGSYRSLHDDSFAKRIRCRTRYDSLS